MGQAIPVKWLKLGNFQLTNTTVGQFSLPERLLWLLIGLETLVVTGLNVDDRTVYALSHLPGDYRCRAPTLVA